MCCFRRSAISGDSARSLRTASARDTGGARGARSGRATGCCIESDVSTRTATCDGRNASVCVRVARIEGDDRQPRQDPQPQENQPHGPAGMEPPRIAVAHPDREAPQPPGAPRRGATCSPHTASRTPARSSPRRQRRRRTLGQGAWKAKKGSGGSEEGLDVRRSVKSHAW